MLLISTVETFAGINDYTFSCWQNGWRKNVNDHSADIFGIETSRYGFTIDLADFSRVRSGVIDNPVSYERALTYKAEKLKELPIAQLMIELEIDGISYRARTCKAGKEKGVKHLKDVRMWESGRYSKIKGLIPNQSI